MTKIKNDMGVDTNKSTKLFNKQFFDNLFIGPEMAVLENVIATLKAVAVNPNPEYWDENEILIRNAVKLAKRHYCGEEEQFCGVYTLFHLVTNMFNRGTSIINVFTRNHILDDAGNKDIVKYFNEDYYPGQHKLEGCTNSWERTAWTRNNIEKLFDIYMLRMNKTQVKNKKQKGGVSDE